MAKCILHVTRPVSHSRLLKLRDLHFFLVSKFTSGALELASATDLLPRASACQTWTGLDCTLAPSLG